MRKYQAPTENFFRLPNNIFDIGLSPIQFAIYAYLVSCAGSKGYCWPSQAKITRATGIGKTAVQEHLKVLQQRQMEWLRASASHGNEYAAALLEHIQSQFRILLIQSALSLIQNLAGMISDSYTKQQKQFDRLDSKERQKLNEKKRAQGQKVTGPEMRM